MPPIIQDDTTVLWQNLTYKDTSFFNIRVIKLLGNRIFFGTSDLGQLNIMKMYDKKTGTILWEREISNYQYITEYGFTEQYIIANERQYIHIIDVQTGRTVHVVDWFNFRDDICGEPRLSVIGDWIYHGVGKCQRGNPDQTYMRYHIPDGRVDTLIDIVGHIDGGYVGGLEPPRLWMHPGGDSLLIFQNRTINFSNNAEKVDVFAWSLTTRDTVWLIDSLTPSGFSSIHSPQIYDNKIYMREFFNVFCINPMDGSIIWNSDAQDMGIPPSQLLFQGDRYFAHAGTRELYAYDINDGSLIWMANADDGQDRSGGRYMVYHKEYIYSFWGKLTASRAKDGVAEWTYKTPNDKISLSVSYASFSGLDGVVIDPETDLLYVHDGFFAMCVQLPDHLK